MGKKIVYGVDGKHLLYFLEKIYIITGCNIP